MTHKYTSGFYLLIGGELDACAEIISHEVHSDASWDRIRKGGRGKITFHVGVDFRKGKSDGRGGEDPLGNNYWHNVVNLALWYGTPN